MPGMNTSGKANTQDYNIGRGSIFLSDLDSTGRPVAYRFVGNCPEFRITMSNETAKHFSSIEGLKQKDAEVVITQEMDVQFTFDEINFENLAEQLSGETASKSNTAAASAITGVNNVNVTAKARWYDLYAPTSGAPATDTSGARIYDVGVVTITGKTEGTDFEVDRKMGRIFIPAGSTIVVGNISVLIAANGSAVATVDEVKAMTKTAVTRALKFVQKNAAYQNQQTEYQFHQVRLRPSGDVSLIGDEFMAGQVQGSAERNIVADPDSPVCTIRTFVGAV